MGNGGGVGGGGKPGGGGSIVYPSDFVEAWNYDENGGSTVSGVNGVLDFSYAAGPASGELHNDTNQKLGASCLHENGSVNDWHIVSAAVTNPMSITTDWTFACWFWIDSAGTGTYSIFDAGYRGSGSNASVNDGLHWYINADTNQIVGRVDCNTTANDTGRYTTTMTARTDEWIFLAWTRDVDECVTYNWDSTNGLRSETFTGHIGAAADFTQSRYWAQLKLYLGANPGSQQAGTAAKGAYLDSSAIWNRALTSTEIEQLINGGDGVIYGA
jgi:hypothetical protein